MLWSLRVLVVWLVVVLSWRKEEEEVAEVGT